MRMRLRTGVRSMRWYSRQGVILTVFVEVGETMKLESVMVSCSVLNSCSNMCLTRKSQHPELQSFVVTGTRKNTPVGEYETLLTGEV